MLDAIIDTIRNRIKSRKAHAFAENRRIVNPIADEKNNFRTQHRNRKNIKKRGVVGNNNGWFFEPFVTFVYDFPPGRRVGHEYRLRKFRENEMKRAKLYYFRKRNNFHSDSTDN